MLAVASLGNSEKYIIEITQPYSERIPNIWFPSDLPCIHRLMHLSFIIRIILHTQF